MEEVDEGDPFKKSTQKLNQQFYFVKFPALIEEIQKAKELNNRMLEDKRIILDYMSSIKALIREEYEKLRWCLERTKGNIEHWKKQLEYRLLEDNDSDSDPELELSVNIDKKIKKLSYQFNHGSKKLVNERRTLREIKVMQRRKEQLCDHAETTWNHKQFIQQQIQESLNKQRNLQERERNLRQKKAKIAKKIMPLEEKLVEINHKRAKVNEYILIAEKQLDDQIARNNNDNTTQLSYANELATKKDLVALEKLCHEQVEEFMSQWNDYMYRANYERSMMLSFEGSKLSHIYNGIKMLKLGDLSQEIS